MVTYSTGNILDAQADVLVNTVNSVGVMGKGIAFQFKKAFPENYHAYKKAVTNGDVKPGSVFLYQLETFDSVKYIANFATKDHWRSPSRIEWIKSGIQDLIKKLQGLDIESVAIPPLGCGLGGLDWNIVKVLIEQELSVLPINIIVFEPSEAYREILKKQPKSEKPKLTKCRAILLYLFYRYIILGEDVSEFVAEKLCYLLQEIGKIPMNIEFQKGCYGPYSGKVRHVLGVINGWYIEGYENRSVKPFDSLTLKLDKREEVESYITNDLSVSEKNSLIMIENLIDGFENPYGLELLSTVHYLIAKGASPDVISISGELDNWSARKKDMFTDDHIDLALRMLKERASLYQK